MVLKQGGADLITIDASGRLIRERKNVHYAFIADVNVHEHGVTVVVIVAAFLTGKERKGVGIWW